MLRTLLALILAGPLGTTLAPSSAAAPVPRDPRQLLAGCWRLAGVDGIPRGPDSLQFAIYFADGRHVLVGQPPGEPPRLVDSDYRVSCDDALFHHAKALHTRGEVYPCAGRETLSRIRLLTERRLVLDVGRHVNVYERAATPAELLHPDARRCLAAALWWCVLRDAGPAK